MMQRNVANVERRGSLLGIPANFRNKSAGFVDDGGGLGVDEQLGHVTFGEPTVVGLDDRDDVRGLAADREVAWPRQGGAAVFAGVAEWAPVVVHFRVAESAKHRTGQDGFDERVL